MIHLVIPAAGAGSRFVTAGYGPKVWADVNGTPMLRAVVDNLRSQIQPEHRVTVLATDETPPLGEDVEVIRVKATRGAVETILAADIQPGEQLMVANCDQLVDSDWILTTPSDGWVLTFFSRNPHHSYVTIGERGRIVRIVEKEAISTLAVAGVYLFADGSEFVSAARAVLDQDRRVLGEFYTSTVLAEMIHRGLILRATQCKATMLGTPEELDAYVNPPIGITDEIIMGYRT